MRQSAGLDPRDPRELRLAGRLAGWLAAVHPSFSAHHLPPADRQQRCGLAAAGMLGMLDYEHLSIAIATAIAIAAVIVMIHFHPASCIVCQVSVSDGQPPKRCLSACVYLRPRPTLDQHLPSPQQPVGPTQAIASLPARPSPPYDRLQPPPAAAIGSRHRLQLPHTPLTFDIRRLARLQGPQLLQLPMSSSSFHPAASSLWRYRQLQLLHLRCAVCIASECCRSLRARTHPWVLSSSAVPVCCFHCHACQCSWRLNYTVVHSCPPTGFKSLFAELALASTSESC